MPGSLMALEAATMKAGASPSAWPKISWRPLRLAGEHRALYRAAAVFTSDYVVRRPPSRTTLSRAGMPDPAAAMRPLQVATVRTSPRWVPLPPSPVPQRR